MTEKHFQDVRIEDFEKFRLMEFFKKIASLGLSQIESRAISEINKINKKKR